MLILLYEILFASKYPIYMSNMFTLCTTSCNLCNNYIPTIPVPKITSLYGLCSFLKLWNSLLENG